MSLPVNRDTVESIMRDMLNRIRALEAKRPQASGGGFGESVEVDNAPGGQAFTGVLVLEFDSVYDPHSIFDGTDTFTIPAGMGGVWQLEHVWEISAE